jgi:predicted component of type VI protein secretion system
MSSARAKLILRVLAGKKTGLEIPVLQGAPLRIGRAPDCQLRPQNDQVSRHHCEIFFSLAGFMVKDCGSRCGTYVNDRRIDQPTLLADGQQLRVGPFTFLAVVPQHIEAVHEPATDGVGDADICAWLDETNSPEPSETVRPDESAVFRRVLRMDEHTCDAAEEALMKLKKRAHR